MKTSFVHSLQYLDVAEKGLPTSAPVSPGLFDPEVGARSVQAGIELFEMADELGFDWVSITEHHYSPRQLTPNPLLLASALTRHVKRARIAILGSTIPLLNPVRVAEEFAMLDLLSGGRLVVGLLRGTAPEYLTYGTNPAESRERYEEGLELILRAWTEPQPFGWEGRYYQFRTISIWPRPLQQPHPVVFLSGNSPDSGALAARHHLGMALSFRSLEGAVQLAQHYRDEAARAGWQPTPDDVAYRGHIYVDETDDKAHTAVQTYGLGAPDGAQGLPAAVREAIAASGSAGPTSTLLARPGMRLATGQASFCGSPDGVAAQLRCFREQAGIGIVDLIFYGGRLPQAMVRRSIELFAREVMPQIRDL